MSSASGVSARGSSHCRPEFENGHLDYFRQHEGFAARTVEEIAMIPILLTRDIGVRAKTIQVT